MSTSNIFTTYKQVDPPKRSRKEVIIQKPQDFEFLDYVLPTSLRTSLPIPQSQEKASDESNLNFPIQPTIAPAPIPVIEKPQQMTYQPTIQVSSFDSSSLIKIDIEDLLRQEGIPQSQEKASDESNLNFPIQPTIAPAPIPVIEKPQQMTYQPTIQVSSFDSSSLIKIDIEDLLRQEGITSINGKAIKFGNKALRSANASYGVKNSNHKKKDPHTGNAMARDISIVGGTTQDYADFRSKLLSNPKVVQWFDAKGWGIINEITPAVLRRTRGTGPHFHFGPDSWAKRTWKAWVSNPNLPVTQAV